MGYPLWQSPVFSPIPSPLLSDLRSPRVILALGLTVAAAAGVTGYVLTRRKPTPEEIEQERRELLARSGRITDGTIMDTLMTEVVNLSQRTPIEELPDDDSTPHIIVYSYRIAGVTYECSQDVTALPDHVQGVRTDLPIQVRYAPDNPANSIVVAESWSGLRLGVLHHQPEPR